MKGGSDSSDGSAEKRSVGCESVVYLGMNSVRPDSKFAIPSSPFCNSPRERCSSIFVSYVGIDIVPL